MSWNSLDDRWKQFFIRELHNIASMSKDKDTQVGSLIIDTKNKVVLCSGYNDLPRGVNHHDCRNTRPLKYKYTVHAEKNAHYNALYRGISVKGMTQICTLFSCSQCAGGVIQSGISEFVCPTPDWDYPSLKDDFPVSKEMLHEAGVNVIFDENLIYEKK